MKLSFDFSFFWLLPAALAAAGISFLFYYRDSHLRQLKPYQTYLLTLLRFIAIFLILILIINPVLNLLTYKKQKPVLIVAVDNSMSMKYTNDSVQLKNSIELYLKKLGTISSKYDMRYFLFGKELTESDTPDFSESQTNFQKLIENIKARFSPGQIAAMVLISDGLYNDGLSPENVFSNSFFPVYPVFSGDTAQLCDLLIKSIDYNKIVYPESVNKIAVHFSGINLNDGEAEITISGKGKLLNKRKIQLKRNLIFQTEYFDVKVGNEPVEEFNVEIKSGLAEKNYLNNKKPVIFEIINNEINVLILARAPHPDISALQSALSSMIQYKTEIIRPDLFQISNADKYQLIVLYQLPDGNQNELVENLLTANKPLIVFAGPLAQYDSFNKYFQNSKIKMQKNVFEFAEPVSNAYFNDFSIADEAKNIFENFPPLLVPFGDYPSVSPSDVILTQKIKNITTQKPLIYIDRSSVLPKLIIYGEGIWKWRLNCYKQTGSHYAFDNFINQLFQLMSFNPQKERFIIKYDKIIEGGKQIYLNAQIFDKVFQPTTNPELLLTVSKQNSNEEYNFVFNRTQLSYNLIINCLPPGDYDFIATAKLGDELLSRKGKFHIVSINPEVSVSSADFAQMNNIASLTGGKLYKLNNPDSLIHYLNNKDDVHNIIQSEVRSFDIISLKSIFIVIILILTIEWIMRKLFGTI